MTHNKIFAKIVALVLAVSTVLACGFTLVACNKDEDKNYSLSDVFKSKDSAKEFSSYKLEIALDDGWSVYTSSGKSSQASDINSDVGYIESLDAFVVQKDEYLSIVKCADDKVYFDGGMKGQIWPAYIGVTALRVKDGLIACLFANGEAGVFDANGNTLLSRSKVSGAESASIDNVIKILDGELIAVNSIYCVNGKSGYTSIYRPTKTDDISSRGMLVARVENGDDKLTYVRGFDGKYVSVVGNSEGDYMFAIGKNASDALVDATTNGTVEDNGKDDYFGEITYIGDGKFFIHEDWTVSSTDDYDYYADEEYYCFKRSIYTPSSDKRTDYTDNADKVFIYLENAYYGGDKGGIDTTSYLKDGFTYASYGLTIVNKVGFYDQYILDEDLDIVMSLSGNYGITIKDQKKEKVGYFDLVMQCVDGYYYNPLQPSEVNIYDGDGNVVGHNDRNTVAQQEFSNNMIVAAVQDPDDDDEYLYGAFNLYGEVVVPFEYYTLSAFRGSYTIGQKKNDEDVKKYYIVGSDGKVVEEMSDGSTPLADIATSTNKQYIYKIGCYMYKVDSGKKDDDNKTIYYYGIKNFNPNVSKNVIMPATMSAGSILYAPSTSPENVFVFDKISVGTTVSYSVYRLI